MIIDSVIPSIQTHLSVVVVMSQDSNATHSQKLPLRKTLMVREMTCMCVMFFCICFKRCIVHALLRQKHNPFMLHVAIAELLTVKFESDIYN